MIKMAAHLCTELISLLGHGVIIHGSRLYLYGSPGPPNLSEYFTPGVNNPNPWFQPDYRNRGGSPGAQRRFGGQNTCTLALVQDPEDFIKIA